MLPVQFLDNDDAGEGPQLADRVFRDRNTLDMHTDSSVKQHFRLPRETIELLERELAPVLGPRYARRSTDIKVADQLAIALSFYATGDHYNQASYCCERHRMQMLTTLCADCRGTRRLQTHRFCVRRPRYGRSPSNGPTVRASPSCS